MAELLGFDCDQSRTGSHGFDGDSRGSYTGSHSASSHGAGGKQNSGVGDSDQTGGHKESSDEETIHLRLEIREFN